MLEGVVERANSRWRSTSGLTSSASGSSTAITRARFADHNDRSRSAGRAQAPGRSRSAPAGRESARPSRLTPPRLQLVADGRRAATQSTPPAVRREADARGGVDGEAHVPGLGELGRPRCRPIRSLHSIPRPGCAPASRAGSERGVERRRGLHGNTANTSSPRADTTWPFAPRTGARTSRGGRPPATTRRSSPRRRSSSGRALDVGEQERHLLRAGASAAAPVRADEADRHDPVLLGRVPAAAGAPGPARRRPRTHLAEARQRVEHVRRAVDRQPPLPLESMCANALSGSCARCFAVSVAIGRATRCYIRRGRRPDAAGAASASALLERRAGQLRVRTGQRRIGVVEPRPRRRPRWSPRRAATRRGAPPEPARPAAPGAEADLERRPGRGARRAACQPGEHLGDRAGGNHLRAHRRRRSHVPLPAPVDNCSTNSWNCAARTMASGSGPPGPRSWASLATL